MVRQHAHAGGKLSAGPAAPLSSASAFAVTQAAWRFFRNERVTLPLLAGPLHDVARQWRAASPGAWALAVHDWSALSYPTHTRKKGRKSHGPRHSGGYDLGTLLLVDGRRGDPIAPLEIELKTATETFSTREPPPHQKVKRLDDILAGMRSLDAVGLGERVAHVIDQEADSVGHYRDWIADNRTFLVRAAAGRYARWEGAEFKLADIHRRMESRGMFRRTGEVEYRGRRAVQHVAETAVTLDRPAWKYTKVKGKRRGKRVPGPAVEVRLTVSRVCGERGETLAVWYLLSNAPAEVDARTLALWYYWRWRVESYFKLLKSAGQDVESWGQETGAAIARRLLVAAMACVLVWKVERAAAAEEISFRDFLVRLSGRRMKYGKAHTAPAILAGLWVYLAILDALGQYSVGALFAMKAHLRLRDPDSG